MNVQHLQVSYGGLACMLGPLIVCLFLTSTAQAQAPHASVTNMPATEAVEAASHTHDDPGIAVQAEATHTAVDEHGVHPPVWLVLPFAILLLMIATGPLFYPHHWHHHYPKYAVALGLFVSLYYIFGLGSSTPVVHAIEEYLSFIALVASLFIAASGIYINVNAKGTPRNNVILLFVGSLVANLIATTGAAMLFVRSYMRLNKGRIKPYHLIFFIFLVANVGGGLTPIGDPPLFLGFLRGVPFFWTLTHVWFVWLPTVLLILAVFYVIDARNKAESPAPDPSQPLLQVRGAKNFLWVLVIILSVFIDPNVFEWVPDLHESFHIPFGIREIIMFTVAVLAYKFADKEALQKNEFTFEPIREVGWLFLGIFATMQPALQLISLFAHDHAEQLTVGMFYWGTGLLSSVLDNAPTYLNFLAAAMGKFGLDVNVPAQVKLFAEASVHAETWFYLQAISIAAVFFGAMTYIGNAPNFMVKAIAEENKIDMPSFMGYVTKYSLPILIPIYFLIYLLFYSGLFPTLDTFFEQLLIR